MSFGKASYTKKEFKKKNHFDLKNGDLVARIIPPYGSCQDNPDGWHAYHVVHFGYKNTEGKHRPFESPEVSKYNKETKTRAIEVRDPAMDRLNELKAKLEEATKSGNTVLAEKLNKLVGFMGTYNVDKNHHLNVMLLDGTVGELKIRHKAFLALQEEMRKLDTAGIDATSFEDGRFFVFSRSGKGNETNFKVDVYKEKVEAIVNGKSKIVEEEKVSVITDAEQNRILNEVFDLGTLFEKPSAEEVAKIVESSDLLTGQSAAINVLFDDKWKAKRAGTTAGAGAVVATQSVITPKTAAPAATQAVITPATPAPVAVTSTQVVAPRETLTQTTIDVSTAAPAAAAPSIKEMSDEEFFREMGVEA